MNDDSRKRYWNEKYVRYWQKRVEEGNLSSAESRVVEKDVAVPSDKLYIDLIRELSIPGGSRVLEMGCGFGRTIPILHAITQNIDAVDISEAMIAKAKENCGQLSGVGFYVSEAEKMPFSPDRFDRVVCFGVFDALYQGKALIEINRVLRSAGRALITGKNDNYFTDDERALVAEENARGKGHPNYFTDVSKLFWNIGAFGFSVVAQRFYLRRGDTARNEFVAQMPARFYEYALILEKMSAVSDEAQKIVICDPVSKTFRANKTKAGG